MILRFHSGPRYKTIFLFFFQRLLQWSAPPPTCRTSAPSLPSHPSATLSSLCVMRALRPHGADSSVETSVRPWKMTCATLNTPLLDPIPWFSCSWSSLAATCCHGQAHVTPCPAWGSACHQKNWVHVGIHKLTHTSKCSIHVKYERKWKNTGGSRRWGATSPPSQTTEETHRGVYLRSEPGFIWLSPESMARYSKHINSWFVDWQRLSVLQTLPQTRHATMEVELTTGAQLASPNQVITVSHGALNTLIVIACPRNTLSSGGVTISAGTQEARWRRPGASHWTLRSEWTSVTSIRAVSSTKKLYCSFH